MLPRPVGSRPWDSEARTGEEECCHLRQRVRSVLEQILPPSPGRGRWWNPSHVMPGDEGECGLQGVKQLSRGMKKVKINLNQVPQQSSPFSSSVLESSSYTSETSSKAALTSSSIVPASKRFKFIFGFFPIKPLVGHAVVVSE